MINTPRGRYTPEDSYSIRRAALEYNIPYTTTLAAAKATLDAIRAMKKGKLEVQSLQEYHEMMGGKKRIGGRGQGDDFSLPSLKLPSQPPHIIFF